MTPIEHEWTWLYRTLGIQPPRRGHGRVWQGPVRCPPLWRWRRKLDTHRSVVALAPIPRAAGALKAIVETGDQVCVASSTELTSLRENLRHTELLPLLTPHVFSVDQVKRPKPAPDVFLFAVSQMGFDPADTIVVEDSVAGVLAARRAGMRVLGFTGGGHVYSSLASRLLDAGAEGV